MNGKNYPDKFNIGDIFSKYYMSAGIKIYFLVVDEPEPSPDGRSSYRVISLEDGKLYSFFINHLSVNEFNPIEKEA